MFLVFSPFCFRDFGSSLLSLLWILFQVGCLFLPYLWSCRFLPCSFFCNIFFCLLFFVFDRLCYISVLLVVWLERSSTGVCRQLDRTGSWCWDEDLWEVSLQLKFLGVWGSLLVQRLGLRAPSTGVCACPLAWEPRSHKLHGSVIKRKKKKRKKKERKKKRSNTISKNKK